MTPNMTAIQMAVLDIIRACVTELKRVNPAVSIQLHKHCIVYLLLWWSLLMHNVAT